VKARAATWPRRYFAEFLGARLDRPLLPGLRSLETAFTIEVAGGDTFALEIAGGCITRAEVTDAPSPTCHVRIDADDLARVIAAEVTPQSLFVRRRIAIRGNPFHALRASSAMQEFCQRFPWRPDAEGVP
jgi:SCP-2 sterol transfer family